MAFLFRTLYRLFWFHLLPPFIYTLRILLLFPIHKSKAKPLVISRKTDRCWSVSGLNKSKNRIRLVPTGDQEEHHDQCSHSISCRLLLHQLLHRPEVRSEGGLGLYSLVTALDTPWSATRSARSGAPGPQPHRESCRSSCSRTRLGHLTSYWQARQRSCSESRTDPNQNIGGQGKEDELTDNLTLTSLHDSDGEREVPSATEGQISHLPQVQILRLNLLKPYQKVYTDKNNNFTEFGISIFSNKYQ